MKNTLLIPVLTFCFLHLTTISNAQEEGSFIKDSVRIYAFNSSDLNQSLPRLGRDSSFVANFELNFWKHNDTTQIKKMISEVSKHEKELMQNPKAEKDSARLKALRARMDILKSAYANAKSGWKDSSQINDLKAKIAKSRNKRIIIKKEAMVLPYGIGESVENIVTIDGLTGKSQFNIFKDSTQYKAFKSQMDLAKNLQFRIDTSQIKELKELGKVNSRIFLSNPRTSARVIDIQEGGDLSQLSLKKSFKGESVETVKKFSITENSKMLKVDIAGKVESGSIAITLTKPDGSTYKSIEIDPSSDVNFEQTLSLKKTSADWVGDWQIKVQTRKANGDYRLNILTR